MVLAEKLVLARRDGFQERDVSTADQPQKPEDWLEAMEASRLALALAKMVEHRLVVGVRIDVKRCEAILAKGRELGYEEEVSAAFESRMRALAIDLAGAAADVELRAEVRVGRKVRAMRQQKRLSQYLVVRRMGGTNVTYLSQVENGHVRPTRDWLVRCAKALGCEVGEFGDE
jgi:hypothetical protein